MEDLEEDEDLLDILLETATKQLENTEPLVLATQKDETPVSKGKAKLQKPILKDADIFNFDSDLKLTGNKLTSVIHNGDTDSSDDEGHRNYENQKYNECGRGIKQLISTNENSISSSYYGVPKKRVSTWKSKPAPTNLPQNTLFGSKPKEESKFQDVLLDPIFGMRIINPKISSQMLKERMQGRLSVRFSDLAHQLFAGNLKDKDWVICGVVANKSPPKTSQKGTQFSIWTLTDLKDDIKTVALFMFSSAHKELWQTAVGTVIGVLNPSVMERRDGSKDEACLSIDTAQKVMVFGQSKDFATCKSIKKNGEKCTAIINLSLCEFCIYHVKQEYQKCSKRSELQANFAGKGLVNLRNKVLGKNEVFYAGKSFMAIPAKKNKKLQARDNSIMENLSTMNGVSPRQTKTKDTKGTKRGSARHLDVNPAQRARDLELLKKLGGANNLETKTNFSGMRSDEVTLEESKATAITVINKLKMKQQQSGNPPLQKKSQYDLKSDLFVNVESKRSFSGKVSEDVSLEDSKNSALSVINKLKAQRANEKKQPEEQTNYEEMLSLDDFEAELECDELNYSEEEEEIDKKIGECEKKHNNCETPKSLDKNRILTNNTPKSNTVTAMNSPKTSSTSSGGPKLSSNIVTAINSPKSSNKSSGGPKLLSNTITAMNSPKSSNKSSDGPKLSNPDIVKTPKRDAVATTNTPKSLNKSSKGIKPSNAMANGTPKSADVRKPLFESSPAPTKTNFDQNLMDPKHSLHKESPLDKLTMGIPLLPGFGKSDVIDLSKPVTSKHINRAKQNALKYIQRTGPIKKIDPNSTKAKGGTKKRALDSMLNGETCLDLPDDHPAKKSKLLESDLISDRFKKMMAMTSRHTDLLERHDDEEREKYFNKQEAKEKMEEKMINTHKVKCKAVKCLQCKYTSFSASDLCKTERHTLKVFDAMKRFYKCGNCKNRMVTLELIPTRPCTNCGSSKWEKTGMMKEKIGLIQHNLSIRGGEQKFVNAVASDANLDLLVPD